VLSLLLLVLELAVIHDPANRRLRHWRDLDKINSRFFSQLQCCSDAYDSELLTFFADQANFRCVDLFVRAVRLLQCDGLAPRFDKN